MWHLSMKPSKQRPVHEVNAEKQGALLAQHHWSTMVAAPEQDENKADRSLWGEQFGLVNHFLIVSCQSLEKIKFTCKSWEDVKLDPSPATIVQAPCPASQNPNDPCRLWRDRTAVVCP